METRQLLPRFTGRHALLALVSLVCLVQLADCDSGGAEWKKVKSGCISESATVMQLLTRDHLECTFAANTLAGHLVAEWNRNTGQCSVFHYQSVCHLIHAAAAAVGEANNCTVFARLPVTDINAFSGMQQKLRAAWVFGASGQERVELVCSKWWKQWQSEAVGWTAEGAVLDGSSSKMTLNGTQDFGDLSLGLTWLLRLKRQPKDYNVLLEHFSCNSPSSSTRGSHFYEGQTPNKLLFSPANQFSPGTLHETTTAVISADASRFINIGVSAVPSADSCSLFADGSFVSDSIIGRSSFTQGARAPLYDCLALGHISFYPGHALQGTVRAVAIANGSMTEAEINSFFELVVG